MQFFLYNYTIFCCHCHSPCGGLLRTSAWYCCPSQSWRRRRDLRRLQRQARTTNTTMMRQITTIDPDTTAATRVMRVASNAEPPTPPAPRRNHPDKMPVKVTQLSCCQKRNAARKDYIHHKIIAEKINANKQMQKHITLV